MLMFKRLPIYQRAKFLSDATLGASDGIVTTFAIITGSAGASFSSNIVLILGIAKVFADGVSMAAGNYLGVKSEIDYEEVKGKDGKKTGSPVIHGLASLISFIISGLLPLLPFIFNIRHKYLLSTIIVATSLFFVGLLRSRYTKRGYIKSGIEMLAVGGFAALVAYFAGFVLDTYLI